MAHGWQAREEECGDSGTAPPNKNVCSKGPNNLHMSQHKEVGSGAIIESGDEAVLGQNENSLGLYDEHVVKASQLKIMTLSNVQAYM